MIKVSVIIPCYNAGKYLEKCLSSLLAQNLKECEFIFVDDGSPDDTGKILDTFVARDPRVVVIHQENRGPGGARNSGIRASRGEYIGFIDSDDTITPDFYEKLYEAAVRTDSDIAWTSMLRKCAGHKAHWNVHFEKESVIENYGGQDILRTNHIMSKIYRRTMFDDGSLMFPEHKLYEDIFFTVPAMFAANRIVTVPGPIYHYTSDYGSITRRAQTPQMQRDRYEALLFVRNFLEKRGITPPAYLRHIRKREWRISELCLFKIKDCGRYNAAYLLGIIPVWAVRNHCATV